MSYLSEEELTEISSIVELISIDEIEDISLYRFDSTIDEYNDFLYKDGISLAMEFSKSKISNVHLLLHKETHELLGYMTLSCDTISLSRKEKEQHHLQDVKFISMPAIKIGKLAINKEISNSIKKKGYGSFLLEMARAYAFQLNEDGVACRFLTVDADVEYKKDTPNFYVKNGFIINNREEYKQQAEQYQTISMRKDIFNSDQI